MTKTFVIEGAMKENALGLPMLLPAHAEGYAAIEAADYQNWYSGEKLYDYVIADNRAFRSGAAGAPEGVDYNFLTQRHIPIGSTGFVLEWLKLMGADGVSPLNVPPPLMGMVSRDISGSLDALKDGQRWYVKSAGTFKDSRNGIYCDYSKAAEAFGDEPVQASRFIDEVISEWRVFVFNGRIRGMRCYSGDEWAMPDRGYAEKIAGAYGKRSYTLDVMVYDDDIICRTDIIEAHDFFSCGLYGFDDYGILPQMWGSAMRDLLGNR